jgi:hypothetical protein
MEPIGAHAQGIADAARTPLPDATIDLPHLKTKIAESWPDRALSLLLDDGGNRARLVTGLPCWYDESIASLEALAETAMRLAALLRIRRGDRAVLAALADPDPQERPPAPPNAGPGL